MDYVCTFVDQDGYLMSVLVRSAHCEDSAWTQARDKISDITHERGDWTRFKIERGQLSHDGWYPDEAQRNSGQK